MFFALAMALAGPVTLEALGSDSRYDLTCVEATSWAMVSSEKDPKTYDRMQLLNVFYIGRLTGRDGDTNWMALYRKDVAQNRKSDDFYLEAVHGCTSRFDDKFDTFKAP